MQYSRSGIHRFFGFLKGKLCFYAAVSGLWLCLCWYSPALQANPPEQKKSIPLFVLHSYSQEYPWTKHQHEAFIGRLETDIPYVFNLSVEYLDTKRKGFSTDYADFMAAYIAEKYAGYRPGAIYVSDDNALLFALNHLLRIFPETPVFFSGVNDYQVKKQLPPNRVTGVFEEKEIAPNLALMKRLSPNERSILLVGDQSETFRAIHHEIISEMSRYPEINVRVISESRIESLTASLRGSNERFVFLTTLGTLQDATGRILSLPETLSVIRQAGPFIIFSMEDVYLYPGILGGYVTSGTRQGKAAAEMVLRYFHGEAVERIPPLESSPNEYIFDGPELDRTGLQLPPEIQRIATIVNPLPTFYQRHLTVIIRAFYTLLILLILVVVISLIVMRHKSRRIAENETRLTALSDNLPDGLVYQIDSGKDGSSRRFTFISAGVERLHGVTASQVLQNARVIYEQVIEEDRELIAERETVAAANLSPFQSEARVRLPSGEVRWRLFISAPRRMPNRHLYWDGIEIDITERKEKEKELRQTENRYRNFVYNSTEGIYRVDFVPPVPIDQAESELIEQLNQNAVVGEVNDALARMYGLTIEEMLGSKATDFAPEYGKRALLVTRAAKFQVREIETVDVDAEGNPLYLLENFTGIVEAGRLIHIWGMQRDITERKKVEARLQQSQKLESIGTLAGGIAHDFNNILFPLLGFAELLRADVPAHSPLHHHIDEIIRATLRARDLVKQILAFSRKGGKNIKPVLLRPVIMEALTLLRASIPATIEIETHLDSDCGPVMVDSTQIHQVIINLGTNAFHAMENTGGRLTLSLREVTLFTESGTSVFPELTSGKYALLTVSDTGAGIEKHVLDKVFDPYFTTKEIGKGTGLGLSVAQGIIKAHKGDIQILSEPGKGTEVRVYLPIKDQPPVSAEEDKENGSIPGGKERLLLVDDERPIVEMERQILEKLGYQVTACTSSPEALDIFRAAPKSFDLVVTDMTMPNITGIQLAEKITVIRKDVPIILCTGNTEKISENQYRSSAIKDILIKPIITSDLAKSIRKVLDQLRP